MVVWAGAGAGAGILVSYTETCPTHGTKGRTQCHRNIMGFYSNGLIGLLTNIINL